MLISEMREPFNNPDYICELKLDGERCIAYLDKSGTILQNKRSANRPHQFGCLALTGIGNPPVPMRNVACAGNFYTSRPARHI